jgi:hypothetical protein
MTPFQYKADCRVEIVEYALKEMQSGAVAVSIRCKVLEWYGVPEGGGEPVWFDWREQNQEVSGDIWIVSGADKGNKILDRAVKSLVNYAGWDGAMESVADGTWRPTPCQVAVNPETYNEQTYYKASFVNDWNRTPGALAEGVKPEQAKVLQAKYGSQLRAIVGNKMRNQAPPPAANKPTAPPKPTNSAPKRETVPPGDDIPF